MKKLLILFPLLLALSPCGAVPVTYNFSGHFDSFGPYSQELQPVPPGVNPHMRFTGEFTYDVSRTLPGFEPLLAIPGYISLEFGRYEFRGSFGIDHVILQQSWTGPFVGSGFDRPDAEFVQFYSLGGRGSSKDQFLLGVDILNMNWIDPSNTFSDSHDYGDVSPEFFPVRTIELSALTGGLGFPWAGREGNRISLFGTVEKMELVSNAASSAVPVPDAGSTLLMFGLALSGLVFVKMKKTLLGSVRAAADYAFRILAAQVRAKRMANAVSIPAHLPVGKRPVAGILAQKRSRKLDQNQTTRND